MDTDIPDAVLEKVNEDREDAVLLSDLSKVGHTSRECLLADDGSAENRDTSESESTKPDDAGTQNDSSGSETSWCIDLMDWPETLQKVYSKRLQWLFFLDKGLSFPSHPCK